MLRILTIVFVLLLTAGCTYYQVTDPRTNKVYYTTQYNQSPDGTVIFKDEVSKEKVSLPASEILPITQEQYERDVERMR